jgi:hypothetical protein
MRQLVLAAAAVIAVAACGIAFSGSASAEDFLFGGRKHCFYADGWHGPGWYWCGYGHRHGHGWGGPEGYRGWRH